MQKGVDRSLAVEASIERDVARQRRATYVQLGHGTGDVSRCQYTNRPESGGIYGSHGSSFCLTLLVLFRLSLVFLGVGTGTGTGRCRGIQRTNTAER